jgi:hypothetical protein
MLKKLKVNLILCLILSCVLLYGGPEKEGSSGPVGPSDSRVLDITKVEENLNQLKKKLDIMPVAESIRNAGTKKDPFVSLIPPQKIAAQESESGAVHEEKTPEFIVSGIIFNGESTIAIIDDEVKKEGEYIGEYEVYRIMEDKVLIKRGDSMFPVEIKKD